MRVFVRVSLVASCLVFVGRALAQPGDAGVPTTPPPPDAGVIDAGVVDTPPPPPPPAPIMPPSVRRPFA
ncbi:MAG: hypothetical protein NT062_21545, partial [Proteobacteria bacterium]|nr:hypothetical protein [Pseudomonadota bacterium]